MAVECAAITADPNAHIVRWDQGVHQGAPFTRLVVLRFSFGPQILGNHRHFRGPRRDDRLRFIVKNACAARVDHRDEEWLRSNLKSAHPAFVTFPARHFDLDVELKSGPSLRLFLIPMFDLYLCRRARRYADKTPEPLGPDVFVGNLSRLSAEGAEHLSLGSRFWHQAPSLFSFPQIEQIVIPLLPSVVELELAEAGGDAVRPEARNTCYFSTACKNSSTVIPARPMRVRNVPRATWG